jgi:hypothetical protein
LQYGKFKMRHYSYSLQKKGRKLNNKQSWK